MSSCFGCGGLQPEVKLLNDCYPPPKQLLASAPDYKPLSSDLSKLTYRCTNQSSKLAKVGEELDRRVAKESARSTAGYAKSRASLLISLAILRALINECRRDLALFSRSIVRIVSSALEVKVYQKGEPDLEVVGRAASCFIAYTTYAEGQAIGLDDAVTNTYLAVLRKFSTLAISKPAVPATTEKADNEMQNRTRLIGLAVLNAVSSSDALVSSSADSKRQIDLIIPAIMLNLFNSPIDALKAEATKMETDNAPSPTSYFSQIAARRPVNDRRAPSIHAHIPGEKGPEDEDVLSAALRSLQALVRQCNAGTASLTLDAIFAFFDRVGWNDVERSCWLAERLTAFITLQYRFVVPTRLVEVLVDLDDKEASRKQSTVLAMVTTILNSHISLVGLGVTDLLNNLVALIVRRVHVDETDSLLPALVQCIASLGTHIYYADQINDIIEEIALRMAEIPTTDKSRSEILRVLIYAITGVLNTTIHADAAEARATAHQDSISGDKGKAPAVETPLELARATGRRNPVNLEVWQETLPLLCESAYAVRAAYARALLLFLMNEIPRSKKMAKNDHAVHRFCNALHASVYTLAMSSCLGTGTPIPTPSGSPIVPSSAEIKDEPQQVTRLDTPPPEQEGAKPEKGVSFNIVEPTPTATPGDASNGANTPTRRRRGSRRVSLPLNKLDSNLTVSSFENVATPFDFAVMIKILEEVHAAMPVAALFTGVPMLLALDRDAGVELVRRPGDGRGNAFVLERKRSIREVCAIMWRKLGDRWGVREITVYANKVINLLPEPFEVPNPAPAPAGILPPPEDATQFYPHTVEGESSATSRPLLDPELLVAKMAVAQSVMSGTGFESDLLLSRLAVDWTVEKAIKNAVERFSSAHVKPAEDAHFDVANVLMSMGNPSYQSFGRPQSKAIDVTDLREALGGRVDTMTSSSPPSIVSTTGQSYREESTSPKRRQQPHNSDVQEVLKDIFKNSKGKKARAKAAGANGVNGTIAQPIGVVNGTPQVAVSST